MIGIIKVYGRHAAGRTGTDFIADASGTDYRYGNWYDFWPDECWT